MFPKQPHHRLPMICDEIVSFVHLRASLGAAPVICAAQLSASTSKLAHELLSDGIDIGHNVETFAESIYEAVTFRAILQAEKIVVAIHFQHSLAILSTYLFPFELRPMWQPPSQLLLAHACVLEIGFRGLRCVPRQHPASLKLERA